MSISNEMIAAALRLRNAVDELTFSAPVTHVYNPLDYAWQAHQRYLTDFANSRKKVVMLGMNPGPWGMAQTGVPFGEVAAVREWMGIEAEVDKPDPEHPKRPIEGFACTRSEVSGRRLWGLFSERFGTAQKFFDEHFVVNYCPLVFMEEGGRNRTPDKLPAAESAALTDVCDSYLSAIVTILEPTFLIGVGAFAEKCFERVVASMDIDPSSVTLGKVLHPSPASPAANRGWSEAATRQLIEQGVWSA